MIDRSAARLTDNDGPFHSEIHGIMWVDQYFWKLVLKYIFFALSFHLPSMYTNDEWKILNEFHNGKKNGIINQPNQIKDSANEYEKIIKWFALRNVLSSNPMKAKYFKPWYQ